MSPAGAEDSTYDMTGVWSYQLTNAWFTCSAFPQGDDAGVVTITQGGNSFTINNSGLIDQGTVEGERYRFHRWTPTQGGMETEQAVWTMQSATVATGHFIAAWSDGSGTCNWGGDFSIKRISGLCQPSDTQMCLQDGRFMVSVAWKDQQGGTGVGHAVPSTDDSGLFWFFSADNMELLIKVLDGCGFNSHYWVFFAATTDQEFTVTVTDTKTGQQVQYTNPLKSPADAVTDTKAFATCP